MNLLKTFLTSSILLFFVGCTFQYSHVSHSFSAYPPISPDSSNNPVLLFHHCGGSTVIDYISFPGKLPDSLVNSLLFIRSFRDSLQRQGIWLFEGSSGGGCGKKIERKNIYIEDTTIVSIDSLWYDMLDNKYYQGSYIRFSIHKPGCTKLVPSKFLRRYAVRLCVKDNRLFSEGTHRVKHGNGWSFFFFRNPFSNFILP
jgi:hypothetical protein